MLKYSRSEITTVKADLAIYSPSLVRLDSARVWLSYKMDFNFCVCKPGFV